MSKNGNIKSATLPTLTADSIVETVKPTCLNIEPEAEIIQVEGTREAHQFFANEGTGDVGGATLLMTRTYAVWDSMKRFVAPTALAIQVNVDMEKKVSTPMNTAILSNPNRWSMVDGMLSPDADTPTLAMGDNPTEPVKKAFQKAMGGRPTYHLSAWRGKDGKRIDPNSFEAVKLVLPAEAKKDGGVMPAVDLNGSAVHVSWNMASKLWNDEYKQDVLPDLEVPGKAEDEVDMNQEAWAQLGRGLLNNALGDSTLQVSDLMSLDEYLATEYCVSIKSYCSKVRRIMKSEGPSGAGASTDHASARSAKLMAAKASLRATFIGAPAMDIYSVIHWEVAKGYRKFKAKNSPTVALRATVYEGSWLAVKLGINPPATCDFLQPHHIEELQGMAKPFVKPEGFKLLSREEQGRLRSEALLQRSAWGGYQRWLKDAQAGHLAVTGEAWCSCCAEAAHSTLVGAVRSTNTKLSAGSTAVQKIASSMRSRAQLHNKMTLAECNMGDHTAIDKYNAVDQADESFWQKQRRAQDLLG